MRFKKIYAGYYRSEDGRYEVQSDGHTAIDEDGNPPEWAAIFMEADENLDWFSTKREAIAFCEAHAAR